MGGENGAVGIRVGVLGPVELTRDGVPVPLTGVPQRVLLARLALAGGRPVSVAELIDALWEGAPPDNAVGNLHSYVSRLRRHTGGDVIRRDPGGYRLALESDDHATGARRDDAGRVGDHATGERPGDAGRGGGGLDVDVVEGLVGVARRQPADLAAATLARALDVWRGEPLADIADRLAFAPDVARLTEWRRHLREECLDRRIDAGQAAEALPEIEALALAEPLRERPHLLLMRALHATGRAAEALTVLRAYRERLSEDHGLDPSPAMIDMQRRILEEDPERPRRTRSANRFFGRTAELAAIRAALGTDRVITLVGPGGVGKTRLMTEALSGEELVVELAERSVPADVAAAVAGALGMRSAPRGGVTALAERLGASPSVLVLDNCEHLLDAVRVLVSELIARCPEVRVLATSRQRLDVAGERVVRIGPLPASDRVALFCDRAALLRADFRDDSRTRELAAQICELVDGLPLAVELAARREAVFGLAHLRDRLGAGLNVLDPARGGDRATGVSATVEWSYRLLDPAAQRLLDHLAVCRGGFGLDALPYFQEDAEPLLAELVDASLVTCDLSGEQPRYRLLETVRHVGIGHLGPDGERQARAAHARWMSDLARELVRRGRDRDPWTTPTLRREVANLQEALQWMGGHDEEAGARMAALLAVINSDAPDPGLTEQLAGWRPDRVETESDVLRGLAAGNAEWLRGNLAEADRLLTAVLDRMPGDHPLRWGALVVRISNAMFAGRAADVRADAERMATDPGAPRWARATGICCAALMDVYGGDPDTGLAWLDRYAEHLNTDGLDGFVPFTRGELIAARDPAGALAWYDLSIAANDRVNQVYGGNVARVARAAVLIRLGRHDEAVTACRETIVAVRNANMTAQVWTMARLVAELLAALGDPEAAAALVAAADADPFAPAVMGPDRERLARLRGPAPVTIHDPVRFCLQRLATGAGMGSARHQQAPPRIVRS
ncbi:putative AfsR-family transcriptional regulator [Actinoplanes missouriensis 431]|uniref:Putative AfsR-family transcriptional regulator n=1 Tax=Actinoplanes missouriensis (strain ATCC 14538 / DSM 43046 / CBS 188.64 / JCM 3121 / NBRC 102363 / NCIMB 12654 / NRRL B-3342 / UNCC 431) TaxID=512565 RepID=I0H241_ACTM4|nr:putative AfsR-family transcriptional regulator [Actinoplanes missouriensis 431]